MSSTGRGPHASGDTTLSPLEGSKSARLLTEYAHGQSPSEPRSGTSAQRRAGYLHPSPDSERDALFRDMQPLVRRLLHQYGQDQELRQDLEGEIYCRFCQLLAAYDPERGVPLRAYLVRTLPLAVYSFVRSHWRRQHRETTLEEEPGTRESWRMLDPTAGWDDRLALQEVLQALPDAIALLPLRQRQVVVWRYYESRSFEEIASSLEIRVATARSLLRHGLNNLRRRIAVRNGSPEDTRAPTDCTDC
jgi:RNA polymerase sigma-70 factor, ECF subfamily